MRYLEVDKFSYLVHLKHVSIVALLDLVKEELENRL
jgi:hypothetical protein